jgi:hypothetical protein
MENRTTAIILTVVAVLLCGCPGICACLGGGAMAISGEDFYLDNYTSIPAWTGLLALCLGVLLMVVPVVVGILTLRQKPAESIVAESLSVDLPSMDEPLPPPS